MLAKKRWEVVKQIKAEDEVQNVPSISFENASWLHFLVRLVGARRILEIGTARAFSTIFLADAAEKVSPAAKVVSLDVSYPTFQEAKKNIYRAYCENLITLHFGDAKALLPTFAGEVFDFIFIDARKKHTLTFFKEAAKLLAPEGMIVVDDVLAFREKMQEFWDYVEHTSDWHWVVIPVDDNKDGIMILRRAKG